MSSLHRTLPAATTAAVAFILGCREVATAPTTQELAPAAATAALRILSLQTISAGSGHSCALTVGGQAYCWGQNNGGELGDGSTTDRLVPTKVKGGHTFRQISAGLAHTCGLTTGDRIMVKESLDQIVERDVAYRHRSLQGPGAPDGLTAPQAPLP